MYFGALSVGADFTAGPLVMNSIKKNKSKAKLIFKDFKADFIKRATSDVVFICNDQSEVKKAVIENLNTSARVSFNLKVEGFCGNELIAKFYLNTSIK